MRFDEYAAWRQYVRSGVNYVIKTHPMCAAMSDVYQYEEDEALTHLSRVIARSSASLDEIEARMKPAVALPVAELGGKWK